MNLQNLTYGYDLAGNVTRVTDSVDAQRACYFYDGRQRLIQAHTQGPATACATGGYAASGAGTDPFRQTYTYANDGFLTAASTRFGVPAATTRTYTRDVAHPHAVDLVTGAAADNFDYDPAGNQTRRTVAGVTRNLAYDVENRLVGISETASTYTYLPDGSRVRRTDGATTTIYLGGLLEITATTADTTWVQNYRLGAVTVGVRRTVTPPGGGTPTGGTYNVVLGDHQGSTSVAVDGDSGGQSRRRYLPYGAVRGAGAVLPTEHTYTGQIADQTSGLMYYGARYYDPATMRFTQADTITPGAGAFAHNRYAYVNDNPINHTDPTGHKSSCSPKCTNASAGVGHEMRSERAAPISTKAPRGRSGGSSTTGSAKGSGGGYCFICRALSPWHDRAAEMVAEQIPGSVTNYACSFSGGRPDICTRGSDGGLTAVGEMKYRSPGSIQTGRREQAGYMQNSGAAATPAISPISETYRYGLVNVVLDVESDSVVAGLYTYRVRVTGGDWISAILGIGSSIRTWSDNYECRSCESRPSASPGIGDYAQDFADWTPEALSPPGVSNHTEAVATTGAVAVVVIGVLVLGGIFGGNGA